MKITQFRYSVDNFGYLLYGKRSAIVIDGGAVDQILTFIQDRGLDLEIITNTHKHADHTAGNSDLIDRSTAVFLDNRTLSEKKSIELDGEKIHVFHTPGHTADSVCFHAENTLVSGDTLFNGTVGNCYSNDLKGFYKSIKMLMEFPEDTVIYAGHDYVRDSMRFAKSLEPQNEDIDFFLKKYDRDHVYSTLKEELKINPYLKFNDSQIIAFLDQKGLPTETELERWESLMSIE